MSEVINFGLSLTVPTRNETNWQDSFRSGVAVPISEHDHTGSGNGVQIGSNALSANAVTDDKIRLRNNQPLRALNAAGNADVNLLKLDSSNQFHLLSAAYLDGALILNSTETLTTSGAISVTTSVTILNGSSLAMTLAPGTAGQIKYIVNAASTAATVTPSATAGANIVTLYPTGVTGYVYLNGEWQIFTSTQAVVTDDVETLTTSGAISVTLAATILNGASLAMTLANGVEGQRKRIVNINATTATVTPSTSAGANTVSLLQNGSVEYMFSSGEWRVLGLKQGTVTDDVETLTSNGAVSTILERTILNGSSLAMTLANGIEGANKKIVNIAATNATITPATSAGTNTATLVQNGYVLYTYLSGEWRAIAGAGCTLS